MRRAELRYASIVAGSSILGMGACVAAIWAIDSWEKQQIAAKAPYNDWVVGLVLFPSGILFLAALYTFLKAFIALLGSLLPDQGRMRRYFDADMAKSGDIRGTVAAWSKALHYLLTVHRWGPGAIWGTAKGIGILIAVVVGMVACTTLVFTGGSAVASWPPWAVVIIILLIYIASKK